MIMNKTIMKCMVLGLLFAGCENGDKEFDDYEYQTFSFATQTPIRTITLGEDVYPTEQDNECSDDLHPIFIGRCVVKPQRAHSTDCYR